MTTTPETPKTSKAPAVEKRGPAGPGPLLLGRRSTVMVVVERPDPEQALQESLDWVQAFERDCGLVLDPQSTELYGVAKASDLKENLRPPRDGAMAEYLDFICVDGAWLHRGDCPAAPPDSNGAPAWAWAYYQTVMGTPDQAFCTIWDVMPLPAAA